MRFLGYNTASYKVVAFAIGGAFAGISGALFALHVGVISPAMIGIVPSIEMVVWVAVGGRKSLLGAIAGTLLVNFGKDWISSEMPNLWLIVMGALFVIVVLVLPEGLAGIKDLGRSAFRKRGPRSASIPTGVEGSKTTIVSEHGLKVRGAE
jgi:urea transport system permease protein